MTRRLTPAGRALVVWTLVFVALFATWALIPWSFG
jgi:hypothetical protein